MFVQGIVTAHDERMAAFGWVNNPRNVRVWAISADPRVPENDRELGKRR